MYSDVPAKWTVDIKTDSGSKEEKTIEDLKLNEIYRYHGELEVKDLMELYRMLFGAEIEEARFLDRPLSKMKYDLLKDMGVV